VRVLSVIGAIAAASVGITSVGAVQQRPASANPLVDSVKATHEMVRGYITKSAEQFADRDYGFRPAGIAAEVRTFAQIIGHIASYNYLYCGAASGMKGPEADPSTLTSKASLQKALTASYAFCEKAFAAITDRTASQPVAGLTIGDQTKLGSLAFNNAHQFEHYGNLVTYFRAKGMVPPSSQPSK
jgi:uncharacterized damage-inducible protein DinB